MVQTIQQVCIPGLSEMEDPPFLGLLCSFHLLSCGGGNRRNVCVWPS